MANAKNSKALAVNDATHTLTLLQDADYTFDFSGDKVKVKQDGGANTNLTDAQFASLTTVDLGAADHINVTGISFIEAGANVNAAGKGNFELDVNLDPLISAVLAANPHDMDAVLDQLSVNGSRAEAIKAVWDYLDDHVTGYYDTASNEAFIRLGVEYGKYLLDGGAAFTDVTAKFFADGAGGQPVDGIADRDQSIHDNLLGNINPVDFNDRFSDAHAPDGLLEELQGLIHDAGLDDLFSRPVYSGYQNDAADGVAAHAFDQGFFFA